MNDQPAAWMPHEKWDALVRGDGCPLCGAITAAHPADEFGFTIADLEISRLRLVTNQYVKGYCVLICHKHVHDLPTSATPAPICRIVHQQLFACLRPAARLASDFAAFCLNSAGRWHCGIMPHLMTLETI